jgi:pSer/pThr/pTyr-binding forkhead associated (FHA) protein
VLTDLGSTNGTYVEGEPVTGETALTPGTTLRFGDVAALFEPHDEAQPIGHRAESPAAEPAPAWAGDAPPAGPRPARRPIRAAAPKPSGPPMWLISLILVAAIVIAYVLLTSS